MAKSLNLKNTDKPFLSVTLPDGKTLLVGTPTKRIFDELTGIQNNLDENAPDNDSLDAIYNVCSLILSRNKTGKEITKEYLEETFDIADIILLFKSYVEFVQSLKFSKN